jgi:hypothetical protein
VGTPVTTRRPWSGRKIATSATERRDKIWWRPWDFAVTFVVMFAFAETSGTLSTVLGYVMLAWIACWAIIIWRRMSAAAQTCEHDGHVAYRPLIDSSVMVCARCDQELSPES